MAVPFIAPTTTPPSSSPEETGHGEPNTMHTSTNEETGLFALEMLLRLRGAAATKDDLRPHLGDGIVGIVEILRGAQAFGFAGQTLSASWEELAALPLPCIAMLRDDSFLLLGKANHEKAIVMLANVTQPTVMTKAEFEAAWSGKLILLQQAKVAPEAAPRFDKAVATRARQALVTTTQWGAARSKALQQAIVARANNETSLRTQELAFLPAALEIVETPPSPLGRTIGLSIIGIFAAALVWSCIGTVDIVAIAPGKIIPSGRTKMIQPFDTGVVRAIQVRDGQSVKAGDVLIDLDTTAVDAELGHLRNDLMAARLDIARLQAAISDKANPIAAFAPPHDAPGELVKIYRGLLVSQSSEQKAKLAAIDGQLAQKGAERDTIQASVDKLKSTIVPLQQRVEIREHLFQKELGSKVIYLTELQDLVGQRQDILVQEKRGSETHAALAALQETRLKAEAEYERTLFDDLTKAQQKEAGLRRDVVKAEQRRSLQRLTAPVDGNVQQLAVHTIGGVVTPAQTLMLIVPADSKLEIEAMVSNRDIGFVSAGQEAAIKIDTFNFTRYGLLHGKILSVSQDAIARDKAFGGAGEKTSGAGNDSSEPRGQELLYSARIALDRTQLAIEDKQVNLAPGMAVTAEIKTGRRRIISYLLSPLARYRHDSLRER
ncbi:MAG TPA: HlyD family type I secretion periplasmic adaptor subunit [Bosea sp. (in: a-proteobacteria)]|jgi:hemolysin D|uniref:HlyD family type I secretion periplasmic adaptor subunit n=1 Tax=Bosea sp. (in: a-proteobacteria) TaxID=1871050 RepID=UPI002E10790A|nr:HlyD family type I secretion periplasmic adaptor subunit [Bosea sp. (in: a-proteobacteria)]